MFTRQNRYIIKGSVFALSKFPYRPTILLVRVQSLLTGLLSLCPWPRTPCQHPRAISPCYSNTASGPLSSSLQPCPAWPLPCQARSLSPGKWLMLKAGAALLLPGCPASGWGGGTGPGYLAQPSPLWEAPGIWPQGDATSSSALVQLQMLLSTKVCLQDGWFFSVLSPQVEPVPFKFTASNITCAVFKKNK